MAINSRGMSATPVSHLMPTMMTSVTSNACQKAFATGNPSA